MGNSLTGKTALVTGVGRSGGIGAAICREIAKEGGNIFFTYWHAYDEQTHPEDKTRDADVFTDELKGFGVEVKSAEVDLSQSNSAEDLFALAEKELGKIDILINNACYDFEVPFIKLSPEILDQHYAVNVRAVTMLCKEFAKRGKPGHIINMTSGQSLGSMGGHKIPYTITKASLEMLAPQLAPELERIGVTIYAVDPGPTDTGWMTDEIKEMVKKDSPTGRINTPEDIGKLYVSLLTSNKYKTGEIIYAER